MSDVINALKRLERAGSEDSRQTAKLVQAANLLGDTVIGLLDHVVREMDDPDVGVELPSALLMAAPLRIALPHYSVERWGDCVGSETATRFSAGQFAAMVAHGWLDELAAWLEDHGTESATAADKLARAAEAMR